MIVFGGYVDRGGNQGSISTAANTLFSNLKTTMPGAVFYVIGCYSNVATPTAEITNTDETLRAAAAAAKLPFISPVTGKVYDDHAIQISDQGPWITANNVGQFVGGDTVHPTDLGYINMAERISAAFDSLIALSPISDPWAGGLHAAIDDGRPSADREWNFINGPGTLATMTPTALTTSVARCWAYNSEYSLTVNRVRWWGIGSTLTHRFAVYRLSDGVQVIGPLSLTTTSDAWNSASVATIQLVANTPYICAISTTATGATAGLRTGATPLVSPPIQSLTPGGLALAIGDHRFWFGQFAVTNGVLPATLPTLARGSGWTAGIPLFFFDSNSAA